MHYDYERKPCKLKLNISLTNTKYFTKTQKKNSHKNIPKHSLDT